MLSCVRTALRIGRFLKNIPKLENNVFVLFYYTQLHSNAKKLNPSLFN